jgi:hypothetical protein
MLGESAISLPRVDGAATWPSPLLLVERSDLWPWRPLRVDRAMGDAPLWFRNADMVVEGSNERKEGRAIIRAELRSASVVMVPSVAAQGEEDEESECQGLVETLGLARSQQGLRRT